VRLTVDGVLHLCLGKEDRIDLRSALRSGASDADLGSLIRAGVQRKPWQHDFREDGPRTIRVMAATGG
jgi:cyclic pyranopterin phosphate synthase